MGYNNTMNTSEQLVFFGDTPIENVGLLRSNAQRVPVQESFSAWKAASISIEVETPSPTDTSVYFFLETGKNLNLLVGAYLKAGHKFVDLDIPIDIFLLPRMRIIPEVQSFDSNAGKTTVVMTLRR